MVLSLGNLCVYTSVVMHQCPREATKLVWSGSLLLPHDI